MDFVVLNNIELSALRDLPYIQRVAYIFGARPYMDKHSSLVGIKRRISYQSLSESLYVEPHPGIQSGSPSKAQLRRALKGLERAGLITIQSSDKQLVLKCLLAGKSSYAQNKAVTKASQQEVINKSQENAVNKGLSSSSLQKADTNKTPEAVIPLSNNNYLYLSFEKFWSIYPVKKSKQKALAEFELLNPDESLITQIMQSLKTQIAFYKQQKSQGQWVAPWKYPANWLAQRAWEDEVTEEMLEEKQHASRQTDFKRTAVKDPFYDACKEGDDTKEQTSNVVKFRLHSSS